MGDILLGPFDLVLFPVASSFEVSPKRFAIGCDETVGDLSGVHDPIGRARITQPVPQNVSEP